MDIPDSEQEYFISWAKNLIDGSAALAKEPHGDEGVVYQLQASKGNYFLKLKRGSDFSSEIERLGWLKNKLPVPEVVDSIVKDDIGALLLTAIEGRNLAALSKQWSAEKVIDELVRVLHAFHATDPSGWPFDTVKDGMVLVHGDACLPNFIFSEEKFGGYIDLGEATLAHPEIDLRAAIWSLQYNLGAGHGVKFLEKYGYQDATEERAQQLRLEYENYQKAHGYLSS